MKISRVGVNTVVPGSQKTFFVLEGEEGLLKTQKDYLKGGIHSIDGLTVSHHDHVGAYLQEPHISISICTGDDLHAKRHEKPSQLEVPDEISINLELENAVLLLYAMREMLIESGVNVDDALGQVPLRSSACIR